MIKRNTKLKWGGIAALLAALIAGITGIAINVNVENGKVSATITYSEEEKTPELTDGLSDIEYGQGEIKVDGEEIKTVESVESNGPVTDVDNTNCPEGEECGRGAAPQLDISSPQAFANDVLGKCIDVDGYYGAQCWDEMAAYWLNYVGRTLSTCGTGAAKGTIADGCWQKNAGSEFTMIWDKAQVQPGDIAVYSTGTWGHIGMAMGYYNNGYFTLLGQNQGGAACPGGGAAGNIINLSTRDFIGAFRPNIYIKPEPKPEPEPEPEPTPEPVVDTCKVRSVFKGDTMGKIMKECWGKITWGEAMNNYANHWHSTKLNPGKTVFYGWTHGTGYGLFAGDVIEYRD
jgi:hypothetical protein